jgi:hypothetical protein
MRIDHPRKRENRVDRQQAGGFSNFVCLHTINQRAVALYRRSKRSSLYASPPYFLASSRKKRLRWLSNSPLAIARERAEAEANPRTIIETLHNAERELTKLEAKRTKYADRAHCERRLKTDYTRSRDRGLRIFADMTPVCSTSARICVCAY